MRGLATKIGMFAAAVPLLAAGLLAVGPAGTAQAAGCGVGVMCGDTGGSGTPPTSGGNTGGNSSGNSGNSGGSNSGSSANTDPFAWSVRTQAWNEKCATRDDGKKARGSVYHYTKKFEYVDFPEDRPGGGWTWQYEGFNARIGYLWSRGIHTGTTCLYPSRTYTTTIKCSIRYYVSVDMTAPKKKTLATASKGTGYAENSKNYKACLASAGSVNLAEPVDEYGFYSVKLWQRAQNVKVEIAYTKDEWDGTMASPKIVSVSPAYNTSPKQGMTGSLDCKSGWKSPGVKASKYWTDEACEGNSKTSYVCQAPAVKIDGADGRAVSMRSVPSSVQLMRDGKARKVVFNQAVKGNNIKVNSYKTRYTRSGTPWDGSLLLNKNLLELRKTTSGNSIWVKPNETAWMTGKQNTMFVSGYAASNPGSKTVLTQEVQWAGTKKMNSVAIIGINPNTGSVTTKPTTVIVPTSGTCTQSVGLEYIRSVGDAQ